MTFTIDTYQKLVLNWNFLPFHVKIKHKYMSNEKRNFCSGHRKKSGVELNAIFLKMQLNTVTVEIRLITVTDHDPTCKQLTRLYYHIRYYYHSLRLQTKWTTYEKCTWAGRISPITEALRRCVHVCVMCSLECTMYTRMLSQTCLVNCA